jgi:hypothetical protein
MAIVKTQNGRAITSGRMIGGTPTQPEPKFIAVGTSATTATQSDTSLGTEVGTTLRVTGTGTQVTVTTTNDTHQVAGTYTNNSGGAQNIQEAATFDTNVLSSAGINIKGNITAANLQILDAIAFTFKETFA